MLSQISIPQCSAVGEFLGAYNNYSLLDPTGLRGNMDVLQICQGLKTVNYFILVFPIANRLWNIAQP